MKKGFSLIELVISLAIISFLALVLSNIFSLNIGILNRSYEDEKEYKEAYTAMTFIDTTIRMSEKIEANTLSGEESNINSNFTGYLVNKDYKMVSYYFYSEDGFLYIYRSDVSNDLSGRANRISACGPIKLHYDEKEDLISIRLISKNGKYKFRSAIYVGGKT